MKIAGVQMDIRIGDVPGNLARMADRHREAARNGAKLVVFPECAVPGYCFTGVDEALPFAEPIPGPSVTAIHAVCRETDTLCVFGMLERADSVDGSPRLFNAAVLVGPSGLIGAYRKTHLPFLGIDMHTAYGDRPFAVHNAAVHNAGSHAASDLNIGLLICYDAAFPEATRSLGLAGADIVCLPTNWPPGSELVAEHVINARALENNLYYIAVNRVGDERGFTFIGQSKIADPVGRTLAYANHNREEILYADIDPLAARNKHLVRRPGEHEIHRLADRRPELYGDLIQPHSLASPGRTVRQG
jgi:predicted amidohydrolase